MTAASSFVRPNTIVLDGVESPGVVHISGAALKRTFDKKKGYGTSGATSTYSGDDLAEFTATFSFWDWEGGQRDEWHSFAQQVLVKPPNAKGKSTQPKAQRIEHWQLNDPPLSITAVNVIEVGQPDDSDETGLVTVAVKFQQHRAPSAALGTPKGTSVPGNKKKPVAQDAADAQIAALMQQLKEEAAK